MLYARQSSPFNYFLYYFVTEMVVKTTLKQPTTEISNPKKAVFFQLTYDDRLLTSVTHLYRSEVLA